MMAAAKPKIIRDNQEKTNAWWWEPDGSFGGTEVRHLPTADYTLEGYEHLLLIEKKESAKEIAGNVFDPAFDRELQRLELIPHAFVVCSFTIQEVYDYPRNSGLPPFLWRKLRVRGPTIMRCLEEFWLKYKTKWIFAGNKGQEVATGIFKRMMESERKR